MTDLQLESGSKTKKQSLFFIFVSGFLIELRHRVVQREQFGGEGMRQTCRTRKGFEFSVNADGDQRALSWAATLAAVCQPLQVAADVRQLGAQPLHTGKQLAQAAAVLRGAALERRARR